MGTFNFFIIQSGLPVPSPDPDPNSYFLSFLMNIFAPGWTWVRAYPWCWRRSTGVTGMNAIPSQKQCTETVAKNKLSHKFGILKPCNPNNNKFVGFYILLRTTVGSVWLKLRFLFFFWIDKGTIKNISCRV